MAMADLSIDQREQISELGRQLIEQDLTEGTGGNLSARVDDDTLAISPSGIPYEDIAPSDIPVLTFDDEQVFGQYDPSVEYGMHKRVYEQRDDVGGVVHTHSPYATTFAVLDEPIPASHYLVTFGGGSEIPVSEYATFGTAELADIAAEALGDDNNAVLLKNHGVLAVGETVRDAFDVASTVEYIARVHYQASAIGEPNILSDEDIQDVQKELANYGQDG